MHFVLYPNARRCIVPVAVSVRGQTVIPAQIRKKYGIRAKSKVEFIDTGEEIVIVPLPDKPFEASYGLLKGIGTKDLFEFRRKERKAEALRERK